MSDLPEHLQSPTFPDNQGEDEDYKRSREDIQRAREVYGEAKEMKETCVLGENILDGIAHVVTEELVKHNPQFLRRASNLTFQIKGQKSASTEKRSIIGLLLDC
jgi:hypothetical protein